jgi:hypothetical protein
MFRLRLLAVSGALVSVVACADPIAPPSGVNPGAWTGPTIQSIRGIVELIDGPNFGLRRSESDVVPLVFQSHALHTLLGREVIVYGNWSQGAFAVSRLELAEDPADELMRIPALSKRRPPGPDRTF